MSDVAAHDAARQLLAHEAKTAKELGRASKVATANVKGQESLGLAQPAIAQHMAAAVLTARAAVRIAAAKQFTTATGVPTEPSRVDDSDAANRAGAFYAKTWAKALPSQYGGGGGTSGGGGSTDSWADAVDTARKDATGAIARIAAYEVASAWNDEHRRNADAQPPRRWLERWWAKLDEHVCKRCKRMNGVYADAKGDFPEGWPPLHPDCRCLVITTLDERPMSDATATHLFDLGTADVHQPGAFNAPRKRTMATLPTKTRNALPAGKFALPSERKYPIHDAAHVRNAAARLEQEKKAGNISSADYATAKRAIARAAKKFGITSQYNKPKARQLHVRAELAEGGSLHVRHMADADRDVFLDGEIIDGPAFALADAAAKPVWIQLAKPGTFRGHQAGAFELNEKVFSEIIANFKATENRRIPIDFEHASEAESTSGSIPVDGAPAQGWILDLKIQDGKLWGLVEWGDKARQYIRAGQYKFFSPAVRFNSRDRVTGKEIGARMTSGALTNNPFLDGLKPLAAKDGAQTQFITTEPGAQYAIEIGQGGAGGGATTMRLAAEPAEYMPRLRAILGLSELSTAAECADQLERLREHFDATGQDPDASHEGIPLGRFVCPLRSLVNMNLGHTWDDVFDCAAKLIYAAIGDIEDDEIDDETEEHTMPEGASMHDTLGATMTLHADGSMQLRTGAGNTNITAAGINAEETSMTPEQIAALNTQLAEAKVSLKDTTTKLTAAEAKATETELKVAELSLSLKDEASKRETAETELKTLKDEKAARELKDLNDRVTLAFETYKDAQKLTDDDKETMLIVLKAKPESFEKKYPKIAPTQEHLLRNLSDKRDVTAPHTSDDPGAVVIDLAQAARTLSAQKGIPLATAQRVVYRAAQQSRPAR